MKKFIYNVFALCLALSATSCGSDYLDLNPENSVAPNVIFSTTDNAKLAVNGITRLMSRQYQGCLLYTSDAADE